ncbi:AGAP005611-PA-like protein [Anopheles sinensis]|uniref:AGAP005611-PA-like protein n=1 Tax=Anopheles sinensis TaxID=74873 RepID=A0A084VC93_ANOSI|nr:AGAP005611-PA-like protein [Anopheles sinensis]
MILPSYCSGLKIVWIGIVLVSLIWCTVGMPQQEGALKDKFAQLSNDSVVHEEVVVAASLYVRKKPTASLRRQKRLIAFGETTLAEKEGFPRLGR